MPRRWGLRPPPDGRSVFRSGIELVNVTATVTDADGRLVGGLEAADFEIYEDGERRPVTYFSRERVALSLGLVLDASQALGLPFRCVLSSCGSVQMLPHRSHPRKPQHPCL